MQILKIALTTVLVIAAACDSQELVLFEPDAPVHSHDPNGPYVLQPQLVSGSYPVIKGTYYFQTSFGLNSSMNAVWVAWLFCPVGEGCTTLQSGYVLTDHTGIHGVTTLKYEQYCDSESDDFNLYVRFHDGLRWVDSPPAYVDVEPCPPLQVAIVGPDEVQEHVYCTWDAGVSWGTSPFAYVWRRNGQVVSTSSSYSTSDTGTSDFSLELEVTDDSDDTVFTSRAVQVSGSGQIMCAS